MLLKEFMIRTAFVTLCAGTLLYLFYPRYQFFDATTSGDVVNGHVYYWENYSSYHGWKMR